MATATLAKVSEYYNWVGHVYDRKHGISADGHLFNFRRYYEPFLKKTVPASGRVLEIGPGTGFYTHWLLRRGLEVVAMDISRSMLRQTKLLCPQAMLCRGDCENPQTYLDPRQIGDGFDAIIGINTFSYFPHKDLALFNYSEILKPGGRLILLDMNGHCPYYWYMAMIAKNDVREWYGEIKESNTLYLRRLLRAQAYKTQAIEHFGFIPNGAKRSAVRRLLRFDRYMMKNPKLRRYALNIGVCAVKKV